MSYLDIIISNIQSCKFVLPMSHQKPLILISNDDGITAPGIQALIDVMKEIGAKHYDFIKGIMNLLFLNSGQLEESEIETVTIEFIVNYIVKILVHFKEDWFRIYLDNVFTKNVDIWGFILAYYPILEVLSSSYSKLTKGEIKIFNQLQFIFVNYLYEPEKPYEPIDMDDLFGDLDILGKLIYFKINGGSYTSYESPFPLSDK